MSSHKSALFTVLLLGQMFGTPALAQTLPVAPSASSMPALTPSQALNRAWRGNPALRQLRRDYARAQARLQQIGLLPNPELGWTAEDFAGSAAFTEDRFTQFTLEWIQTLPLGGRLERARRLAELESELLGWEYRIQQLRLAREVYVAHARLRYLAARLVLARDVLSNARETASLIQARVDAGKQPPVAALQANEQVLDLEAEVLDLVSQQRVAALELSTLWGGTSLEGLGAAGGLTRPVPLVEAGIFRMRLSRHPRVARWQLEGEARQEAVAAAEAQATPDLTASGGLRYHPAADWGVVASLTLPLPMFSRNQGTIEDARLHEKTLAAEREQDLQQLGSELERAHEAYSGAYQRWELHQRRLQVTSEAFRIALIVFDAGKSGYLEVLQSQQSYFEARRDLIETQWEIEQAQITLRTLTSDLDPVEDIPITEPEPNRP